MGGFGHVGIPTTDFKKAKKFFGNVFGWTFEDMPDIDYVVFHTGSRPGGGFYRVKKMPKKGQVNVYLEVEDIDAALKAVKKAKGKVLVKRTPIAGMGWFAEFATPDGCYLSLWEETELRQPPVEASSTVAV
jgi:hypothetical protein